MSVPTLAHTALVALAGCGAGAVNAIAGGGTLLTFPALLAVGVPPVLANTTSAVGLLSGYAGGSLGYRRELGGQAQRVRSLATVSLAGGVAGAVLLLVTPAKAFAALVPYLVLTSCLLLAVQPRLARAVAAHRERAQDTAASRTVVSTEITLPLVLGALASAVYGSYFGAGLGVLLLAVLGVFLEDLLQRLNALKGLLSLLVNAVGALVFVLTGQVEWLYAGVIALASPLGGYLGSSTARRIAAPVLRAAVVTLGVAVAIVLMR